MMYDCCYFSNSEIRFYVNPQDRIDNNISKAFTCKEDFLEKKFTEYRYCGKTYSLLYVLDRVIMRCNDLEYEGIVDAVTHFIVSELYQDSFS